MDISPINKTPTEPTPESTMTQVPGAPLLRASINSRQMSMIAIGGVIGAGLFVGSGSVVNTAGPAALVAYTGCGLLVVLIMRMLAELSVASPTTGSFAAYASREFGSWAGQTIGWLYAYSWSITVGIEAVIGGGLVHELWPQVPAWLAALVCMALLTGCNLLTVRAYGEVEFWFSTIKVGAICLFLVLGVVAIAGWFPGVPAPGTSNLLGDGGFAPHGWAALLPALLVVMFSYNGTEVVTIAAGEAVRPAEAVRKAMRSTVLRILTFYIGSVAVFVTLMPSDDASITRSPYAAVLEKLGIPGGALIMQFLVLVAVLSCLNSGIYTSSRMLFALSSNGEAPAALTRTSRRGVPVRAILAVSVVGFVTGVANYFLSTSSLFVLLTGTTGSIVVLVYLCIAATQIRSRSRARREGVELPVRMWGFPYISWAVIVLLLALTPMLAVNAETRPPLVLTLIAASVAMACAVVRQRRTPSRTDTAHTVAAQPKLAENDAVRDGQN